MKPMTQFMLAAFAATTLSPAFVVAQTQDAKNQGYLLDDMLRQLDGATYDTILATGHTDRFGGGAYNQKLSERRAGAVKDYLISKNVQASRIDAEGKGETQPMTKPGECLGKKGVQVVACLQPDRRVDVEMQGSKTVVGSL